MGLGRRIVSCCVIVEAIRPIRVSMAVRGLDTSRALIPREVGDVISASCNIAVRWSNRVKHTRVHLRPIDQSADCSPRIWISCQLAVVRGEWVREMFTHYALIFARVIELQWESPLSEWSVVWKCTIVTWCAIEEVPVRLRHWMLIWIPRWNQVG